MQYEVVEGDLLSQSVEAIVNPWNRNTIPWRLLLPQGVSGAIKRRAGTEPFQELQAYGRLALGAAVLTTAGRLPFRKIIHVAGINDFWQASERSIRLSVGNAIRLAEREGIASLALPLIGAGSGSFSPDKSLDAIKAELDQMESRVKVSIVVYREIK